MRCRCGSCVIASAPRLPDRIDTAPRFTQADADRLNARFAGTEAAYMLETVVGDGLAGRIALVSSFGAQSAVLLHLVTSLDARVPVLFLDTGKHFAETLAYRDLLAERLDLELVNLTPDPEALAERDAGGERWSFDPDGCCAIRKVGPLAAALREFDATITGRKGFQSATRAGLPRFEIDRGDDTGRLKFNPLADWTKDRIETYFVAHDLPRHPLEAAGYPSIGCAPCTARVAPGDDPRSGRWAGQDKTECGIHSSADGGGRHSRQG